ncbi:MAG: ParA family protein [Thiomargarita sp.]|nr:ParA family protein [Thiomargarita sp.]
MTAYAFWNNKGGVGKSFLCFIAASEYAHRHPNTDVYVIDLCPQANLSEILLGGYSSTSNNISDFPMTRLIKKTPRATVAGYLEARLNSPFSMIADIEPFLCQPSHFNSKIPHNLRLVCGDNLLEILSEAIRQTSQLSIPTDAWKQVVNWIKDLMGSCIKKSGERETLFLLDCNPSFAVYTQLALVAANDVIVPFTADDSSRRGIENVIALLYGVGDAHTASYAKINFAKRAKEENVDIAKLHTFVSNRQTLFNGKPSKAFKAMDTAIKNTMKNIHRDHRSLFANPKEEPSKKFVIIPDYHSACVVAGTTGTPLQKLKAGPHHLFGERVQINPAPLKRYCEALTEFISHL